MRTVKIEKDGSIILDGVTVDITQIKNKPEFISSILTLDVELSNDMNVTDIIHFFYDAKKLIRDVLSEEYEVVRAIITTNNLPINYKVIRLYKSFKIEKEIINDNQEFIYLIPEIELIPSESGEDGIMTLGMLPIIIDENIKLVHNDFETDKKVVIQSKTKLSLLDLMICVFDELPNLIRDGLKLL